MLIDRRGTTLDGGRIVVDEFLGRMWLGRSPGGDVVIAFRHFPYARSRAQTDELFRYDVPGIAKLAFLGYPDGEREPTPREIREGREPVVALAEERPSGMPLSVAAPLDERATIQLGIDMCATAIAWGERREFLTTGVRPETVYVHAGRFTGATVRTELFLPRDSGYFEAPASGGTSYSADDVGFVIARLMWIALLREDPYRFPGALNDLENIWEDKRRPWTGPPALGRVLEQVLVADRRMPVRAFRDALQRL